MALLTVMSCETVAEWVNAGYNKDLTAYMDPTTRHRSGDMVMMLSLVDHKTIMKNAGKTYLSIKAQHEYDCGKAQARILFFSTHSENMGKGDIVRSDYSKGEFEPIPPRSIVETLWKTACIPQ